MKILLLADTLSSHTFKWATALQGKGCTIGIFCLSTSPEFDYAKSGIEVFCPVNFSASIYGGSLLRKISFTRVIPGLKKTIREFRPDIIHAHFASSYGLLGALSGFHPFIISVWGTDIFDFPESSFLAGRVIRFNLNRADLVLSTSHVMVEKTEKYTSRPVEVVPFGIDTAVFRKEPPGKPGSESSIVIGTIKSLESKYGIEYLIQAFEILVHKHPDLGLRLLIVGGGSLENELKQLADSLGIGDKVTFTGRIPYREVSRYYRMLDIYAALSVSESESFGVAILEASATGLPVVVSDVGGLPEVVENGQTGFVVPSRNSEKAAEAMERLVLSSELRNEMGIKGRSRVQKFYEWSSCVDKMMEIYNRVLAEHNSKTRPGS